MASWDRIRKIGGTQPAGWKSHLLFFMKANPLLAAIASTALALASIASAQTPPAAQSAPATLAADSPPDQVIYAPRLPTAQELTDAAVARGVAIERIQQDTTQVTATYRLANGQLSTVAYALLPSASPASAPTIVTTPPPAVVMPRTVIYRPQRQVVYYDPFFYDPWYRYPSVSIGLGFGFGHYHGRHHGHYRHGGFRHGHRH